MIKLDLRDITLPVLGCAIAIAYGGTALAFSLVTIWPLLPSLHVSAAVTAWLIDMLLGAVLLVGAFATLMRRDFARKALLAALIGAFAYELTRGTVFFPLLSGPAGAGQHSVVMLSALLIAAVFLALPSSVRYTRSTT